MHDPRLGRFFAVDPLASEYSYNSPYAFSENRVVDGVELEGLEYFRITHSNGLNHLALIDLYSDFKVEHINEEGQISVHKNFVYSNFQQRMKGPNGEPFSPENQVDKINKSLYAPMSGVANDGGVGRDGEQPDFHIMTQDHSLVKKVRTVGPGFHATKFESEEDAFNTYPMEEDVFDEDGELFRKKILPENDKYDYVNVYQNGYSNEKILIELQKHGVDIKNKEINFLSSPIDPAVVTPESEKIISVEFGTYE